MFYIIETAIGGLRVKQISQTGDESGEDIEPQDIRLSEDGSTLAWWYCEDECVFVSYSIGSETYENSEISCSPGKKLKWGFSENRPKLEYGMCVEVL